MQHMNLVDSSVVIAVRTDLRIGHSLLDETIRLEIMAAIRDLVDCGIKHEYTLDLDNEGTPLLYHAICMWCRSLHTDDPVKSEMYMKRYEALKASMMMREGFGRPKEDPGNG